MSTGEKRIFELTETQTFGNGDYLPLDNLANNETKKIEAKKLGITYTMTDTEDGFSFDGSNGYHYEKVIPKDAEMSYDDYEDLTEAEKTDGSNRFIPDFPEEEKESEIWTRVGRTPLETDAKTVSPAINELKGRIDDSDDEITEIKSNLTEKASKDLTWVFSSVFSLSATYDASSFWDEMNEIIIMVANNNTGTNASYYPIHYYKEMSTMTVVNGYGLGGNTFCQINFNPDTKIITMVDCRNGGTQYSPFVKFYYK